MTKVIRYWRWFFLVGVLYLPFAVMALFIVATREWMVLDSIWDYLGISLSAAAGLLCLWLLPIDRLFRALLSFFYAPLISYFLFFYSIFIVGQRYGGWPP